MSNTDVESTHSEANTSDTKNKHGLDILRNKSKKTFLIVLINIKLHEMIVNLEYLKKSLIQTAKRDKIKKENIVKNWLLNILIKGKPLLNQYKFQFFDLKPFKILKYTRIFKTILFSDLQSFESVLHILIVLKHVSLRKLSILYN